MRAARRTRSIDTSFGSVPAAATRPAAVAVAHRLCRILFAMLRDGSDFEPQRIGVEERTFTRTVTYKYRLTAKPTDRLPSRPISARSRKST